MSTRIPLTIVSGFLGSGKTTLLQRFLRMSASAGTGVVVNEFGEVGLDHRLLVHAKERLERVDGGCLCCARRPDIARALHELVRRVRDPGAQPLTRIVLETTGLADPAPIIAEIGRDPWMQANIDLAGVVCVLDAVTGLKGLEQYAEVSRQIAVADLVLVSKTDLDHALPLDELINAVHALAPDVPVLDVQAPEFDIEAAFKLCSRQQPRRYPATSLAESKAHVTPWRSFVLPMDASIDWPAFTLWLSALLHTHGNQIVRVKGMLRTSTSSGPLIIHGVQHVMHPPTHLPPEQDDGSPAYLVFITQEISREMTRRSLEAFLAISSGIFAP